jgi:hypothetical protein
MACIVRYRVAFFSVLGSLCAMPAVGHDLGVARVELRELAGARYEMDVTLPWHGQPMTDQPILPSRCALEDHPAILKRPGVATVEYRFTCAGSPLESRDVLGIPWRREGAFVAAHWLDGSSQSQYFSGAQDGEAPGVVHVPIARLRGEPGWATDVARRYLGLGVEHILTGWDHLAFVFCLCLVANGWRLVKLVTGFTLGHSLSLALATFGLVRLPSPPVEACIALSIAFMAREALLPPESRRHGAGLVVAFGLLHGLGFAGALQEVGIGTTELLLGLVTFNLGVEIGQLMFVAGVLACMAAARRIGSRPGWRTAWATGLGVLAAFWTLQRIAIFPIAASGIAGPLAMAAGWLRK